MKRCFKCGESKPLSEFYRHSQMADGHLGKCKHCARHDVKVDRQTNPHAREYDRQRATQPQRVALRARIVREWRHKHPGRARAQQRAERLYPDAPHTCEGCGLQKRVERHHPDYDCPLVVVWLCKPCHAIADKVRRRLEEHAEKSA